LIDVVSIKFKNRGKSYYFDPNGLDISTGDKVIVETSKGLEIADCFRSPHAVEETAVVQPLRPVVRIATGDDLRVEEINKHREKEAFTICEKKINEHELDMKLVDVECSFDGTKTTFFFTSDGRVDFRELVKDLAGIFRNRIELRQIGVRDEAKMIGGLGICGRPYCCHQFLDDFQPVSTKMAKVQSLSLNPAKISGSCGRLMCCLRYEQDCYEDLLKRVPKQGAYVETKDGYGTAVQINLLRQTIKVRLDKDNDDSINVYTANEYAVVPGGRPKEGEEPPKVYFPPETEQEEPELSNWTLPEEARTEVPEPVVEKREEPRKNRRERREGLARQAGSEKQPKTGKQPKAERAPEVAKVKVETKRIEKSEKSDGAEGTAKERKSEQGNRNHRRRQHKPELPGNQKQHEKAHTEGKKPEEHAEAKQSSGAEHEKHEGAPKHRPNRRRYYHHGKGGQGGSKE